jgi:putative peptidoglycan lipid II flippase
VRAFFSLQDTKTPLFAALFSEIVHLSLIPLLLPRFAVAGIAIAFSVGAIVNILILYMTLRRRVVAWRDWEILFGAGRIVGVALIAATVAQLSKGIFALTIDRLDTFLEVAIKLGVGAIIGLAAYIFFSAALGLPEYLQVKRFIWRRLLRQPETVVLAKDHPEQGDW